MTNRATFLDYMKKAWQDTMMPLSSSKEKQKGRFVNYFLGWPKSKEPVTDYLLNGGFFLPFYNVLRRPPELILNLLSETFGYFKNKMLHSDNKVVNFLSFLPQMVQGLFKALYLLLRIITSPLISMSATAKYIDDNIENPGLKAFLVNSSIITHGLFLFGQIVGLALLGSMVFWPVLVVVGIPIAMAAIDAANTPEMKFSWNNSEINTASSITSESSDYSSYDVPEVTSEYEPAHYASLFNAAKSDVVVNSYENSEENETSAGLSCN